MGDKPAITHRIWAFMAAGILAASLALPAAALADDDDAASSDSSSAQDVSASGDGTTTSGAVVRAGGAKSGTNGSPSEDSSGASGNSKAGSGASSGILEAADTAGKPAVEAADEATPLEAEGNVIDEGQLADNSFLYDAQIGDLASADSYYDRQTVQVTGEVVGDAVNVAGGKPGRVWIVLRDPKSGATVPIIISKEDAEKIDTFGRYGAAGTTLRIKGTYYLDDIEQQGESDIHATKVVVVSEGGRHSDLIVVSAFKMPLIAIALGAALTFLHWYLRERNR